MKLTTITHVTVDGVMQGLGGSDEDRRGGFARGGWALRSSMTRPQRFSTRSSSAPTRSCSAAGPTRFLPAPGEPAPGGKSGQKSDLRGVEHAAQVRGIDHAHRPALAGHFRPLR